MFAYQRGAFAGLAAKFATFPRGLSMIVDVSTSTFIGSIVFVVLAADCYVRAPAT